MEFWSLTDPGIVRTMNQDACFAEHLDKNTLLCVVCDGMGGAKAGNVASNLAMEVFAQEMKNSYHGDLSGDKLKSVLENAVKLANFTVYDQAQQFEDFSGMGTTLSAALVRGVAFKMQEKGFQIGGFDAAITSDVLGGSGLSSSAAYEVLICAILDTLYNGFTMDSTLRAQISQFAENEYFGKPSGLMDQMASSTGGLVTIDFKAEPQVQPLSFGFNEAGYSLVVVNTGGSHDNLTPEYAAVRSEMQDVAAFFGEKVLRKVRPEQFWQNIGPLREKVGERAILRAMHFFAENDRVKNMVQAVRHNDLGAMFENVIASGESSWMLLQNIYPAGGQQQLSLALAMAAAMLKGKGAWRVHGGGFAGTTLNFVPNEMVDNFVKRMEAVFGVRSCFVLDVRPEGAAIVLSTKE